DPSSAAAGGSIGCVLGSQLVAPLPAVVAALTPGTVSQPVKYQTSWLLLLVTSRQTESAAGIVGELFSGSHKAFNTVLTNALKRAQVTVSPNYGRWSLAAKSFGEVTPPTGPPARFVPVAGS
ncbi:MAG: peptidylprolyl isomerase, partial [Acidimicrobiales bacterium]